MIAAVNSGEGIGKMAPSWIQILIVVVLLVLLFGRGKISDLMGDVAQGIKSFKRGIAEDEAEETKPKAISKSSSPRVKTSKTSRRQKAKTS